MKSVVPSSSIISIGWQRWQLLALWVLNRAGGTLSADGQPALGAIMNNPIFCHTPDGDEPLVRGSAFSPTAREDTGPVALIAEARSMARARRGDDWSAATVATFNRTTP